MEHIAIMRKSWGLTSKILSREKKIESRWYNSKYPPWNRIKKGEIVWFKDSGEPVAFDYQVPVEQPSQISGDVVGFYAKFLGRSLEVTALRSRINANILCVTVSLPFTITITLYGKETPPLKA